MRDKPPSEQQVLGPGMTRQANCVCCEGPLTVEDGDRCVACRPRLSREAEAINTQRRVERDAIVALEREAEHIATLIKRLKRRLRWQS